MSNKVKTMDLKGKEYAQVKDRVKKFREDCPSGLIDTVPTIQAETVTFKARVLKDKADPNSAEASGHSFGKVAGDKDFEKLETIAVGRALAFLGYAQDGEIASGEEMEEFLNFQEEKKQETILTFKQTLEATTNLAELSKAWSNLPGDAKKDEEIAALKDELKIKFQVNESK